jgi:hypothetical protein
MPQRSLERLAAASGLVLVALLVTARVIVPTPVLPEIQAGGLVRSYYLENQSLLEVRGGLAGLAGLAALVLVGALVGLLRRGEGMGQGRGKGWLVVTAGCAGAATVALWLAATATLAALVELRQAEVLGATQGNPAGALALFQLYRALGVVMAWPLAGFVAAVSAGLLWSGLLPRWFGWAGLGVAALVLVGLLVPPLPLGQLTEGCLWLWLAALSVLLTIGAQRAEPSAVA